MKRLFGFKSVIFAASIFFLSASLHTIDGLTESETISYGFGSDADFQKIADQTGKLYSEEETRSDGKVLQRFFRETGVLKTEEIFENQKITERHLYDVSGKLRQTEIFDLKNQGVKTIRRYGSDGALLSDWNYEARELIGEGHVYSPDGTLKEKIFFKQGITEQVVRLDKQGNIIFNKTRTELEQEQKHFQTEKTSGTLQGFSRAGRAWEETFSFGALIEKRVCYDDGTIFSTHHYDQGKRHGLTRLFWFGGGESDQIMFENGVLKESRRYDSQGVLKVQEKFNKAGVRIEKMRYEIKPSETVKTGPTSNLQPDSHPTS